MKAAFIRRAISLSSSYAGRTKVVDLVSTILRRVWITSDVYSSKRGKPTHISNTLIERSLVDRSRDADDAMRSRVGTTRNKY